jgi:hypothetical protein
MPETAGSRRRVVGRHADALSKPVGGMATGVIRCQQEVAKHLFLGVVLLGLLDCCARVVFPMLVER